MCIVGYTERENERGAGAAPDARHVVPACARVAESAEAAHVAVDRLLSPGTAWHASLLRCGGI